MVKCAQQSQKPNSDSAEDASVSGAPKGDASKATAKTLLD